MNPRRGAGELGVIIKLYDMDSVPEPTFLAILAENIKKWSAVTVEYQRRSDERLERASDMVHGLIETSGAMMKAFEFVSKTKSAETDALRRCNEASQERIACLVRERNALRDQLSESQTEVRRLTELSDGLRKVLVSLVKPTPGATVTIGDVMARASVLRDSEEEESQ